MSYVRNLPGHVREMPLDRLTDRFWSRVRADGALDALLALAGGRAQYSADAPQGSTPGAGGLLSSLTVGDTDAVFWRDSESGQRRNAKQGLGTASRRGATARPRRRPQRVRPLAPRRSRGATDTRRRAEPAGTPGWGESLRWCGGWCASCCACGPCAGAAPPSRQCPGPISQGPGAKRSGCPPAHPPGRPAASGPTGGPHVRGARRCGSALSASRPGKRVLSTHILAVSLHADGRGTARPLWSDERPTADPPLWGRTLLEKGPMTFGPACSRRPSRRGH